MPEGMGIDPTGAGMDPRAPLGHLARLGEVLEGSQDIDAVVSAVLSDLTVLPGVRRVGLALTEGGGRRLRFTASDRVEAGLVDWCHIDAYDDVPLTTVVRTGESIFAGLEQLDRRFGGMAQREQEAGTRALAAVPLPGTGSPVGGLIVFFDRPQGFDVAQIGLLEAAGRRTSDAVQRIRSLRSRDLADELAEVEAEAEGQALVAAVRLPDDPTAPGEARRFLRRRLAEWPVEDEVLESAQLCVSEVVTNAVNHAHTTCDLRVSMLDGVLTVLVRDHGGEGEVVEPVEVDDPLAVHGRGLMLVEAIADRWGSESDVTGTTVWFALEAGRTHSAAS